MTKRAKGGKTKETAKINLAKKISLKVGGLKVEKSHKYTPKSLTRAYHKKFEYLTAVPMAAKGTI